MIASNIGSPKGALVGRVDLVRVPRPVLSGSKMRRYSPPLLVLLALLPLRLKAMALPLSRISRRRAIWLFGRILKAKRLPPHVGHR